jgi:hypothetical protein
VSLLDGGVDRLAEPEIVRGDDQPVQCANSARELNCATLSASGAASDSKGNARIVSRSGAAQVLAFDQSTAAVTRQPAPQNMPALELLAGTSL